MTRPDALPRFWGSAITPNNGPRRNGPKMPRTYGGPGPVPWVRIAEFAWAKIEPEAGPFRLGLAGSSAVETLGSRGAEGHPVHPHRRPAEMAGRSLPRHPAGRRRRSGAQVRRPAALLLFLDPLPRGSGADHRRGCRPLWAESPLSTPGRPTMNMATTIRSIPIRLAALNRPFATGFCARYGTIERAEPMPGAPRFWSMTLSRALTRSTCPTTWSRNPRPTHPRRFHALFIGSGEKPSTSAQVDIIREPVTGAGLSRITT
jgi:hypothetical protein